MDTEGGTEFGQAGEIPLANGALQCSLLLSLRKVSTSWARQTRFIGKGVYREVVCRSMNRYRVCLSSRWMSDSGECSLSSIISGYHSHLKFFPIEAYFL